MRLVVSWLREFADVPADPAVVASRLASCGFAVESIDGDTIDFEITANRPDAMSVIGLAREASTAFQTGTSGTSVTSGPTGSRNLSGGVSTVGVRIDSPLCRRYAVALADVTVGPSPAWLADRLTAAGVRPINNVVDVTNYVMLERGQPMHAFDTTKLAGGTLGARMAKAGERLTTLDGDTRTLDATMLVIADRDRAVAVAGVMGGRASEVSAATTRIAIESACFDPASVRRTSKKLGLKTEASMRFERGADIGGAVSALARALELLESIGGGRRVGEPADLFPAPPAPRQIDLARAHLDRLIGAAVPDADVARILTSLGFDVAVHPGRWRVTVPTFRVDVLREADLIEEVARHWGFDRVPAALPPLASPPPRPSAGVATRRRLAELLSGIGLQEAVTFTFMERAAAEPFAHDGHLVPIANPLSEKFAVLRPSLLPGLLDALVYNRRREAESVRLFEIGSVFAPEGEAMRAGWIMSGPRSEHWSGNGGAADFFDAKGVAELLASALDVKVTARAVADWPWYVPGRAATLVLDSPPAHPRTDARANLVLAHVGQLRPEIAAARGLDASVVVAGEFLIGGLSLSMEPRAVDAVPRMPSVVRDLSILVPESLPAADVRATIWSDAPSALVDVREFDRYQGKGVPAGSVSLSLRLRFRDAQRTLTDGEVQLGVDRIVAAVTRAHGASIRGAAGHQSE